jgi:hypothetical protein
MTRGSECCHCASPVSPGVTICSGCRTTLAAALTHIATYHGELLSLGAPSERERSRRRGKADPTGNQAVRDDVIEKDAADNAAWETRNQLVAWTRALIDDHAAAFAWPADTVVSMSEFLRHNIASIATMAWVKEFVAETLQLEQRLRRIVERGKGQWYAGKCGHVLHPAMPHDQTTCACACHRTGRCDIVGGCGLDVEEIPAELCDRELFVPQGTSYVRCPACGTNYSVEQRRRKLLQDSRSKSMPLKDVANLCAALRDDEPSATRLYNRLKKWTERGDLVWADHEGPSRLYRVGDVLDMLTARADRRKRKTEVATVG